MISRALSWARVICSAWSRTDRAERNAARLNALRNAANARACAAELEVLELRRQLDEAVAIGVELQSALDDLNAADNEDATITVQRNRARASEEALRRGIEKFAANMMETIDRGGWIDANGVSAALSSLLDATSAEGYYLLEELDTAHAEAASLREQLSALCFTDVKATANA